MLYWLITLTVAFVLLCTWVYWLNPIGWDWPQTDIEKNDLLELMQKQQNQRTFGDDQS